MGEFEENKKHLSSSWFGCTTKCFPISKSPSSKEQTSDQLSKTTPRKPGGWKSMPYILGLSLSLYLSLSPRLYCHVSCIRVDQVTYIYINVCCEYNYIGNETFERLATIGLLANFTVFLLTQFHMEQVQASNVINIWSGITNFAPLFGAFISDAYVGRFRAIAFSSFASLLGMVAMVLVVSIPQLHPPECTTEQTRLDQCKGPTGSQFGFLILGLGLLTVGSAGIRPCSLPFGLDQFDPTTEEGRKGINSFFNWYYATFTIVLIIALTVVVYIQDSVSWILGFGIPTGLMVCSIILFFVGTKMYIYVKPEGSVFSGIGQSLVVAYKKRKLKYPVDDGVYYDPPIVGSFKYSKLPLTNKFRFLNKAAIILEGEVLPDGSKTNPWQLCSVQQIEEVKCLIKVIPIWASGIITFLAMAQQGTFTVNQALKMDRHLGPNFQIPAGTLSVISMITLGLWIPFYDRILVPFLRKITKIEGGITLLQRIGIGIVCSILSMIVAGIFERMRRNSAIKHGNVDGIAPISVMWLAPQLILMGFSEAFNIIGQIEFYYKEFPESMRSLANSLFFITSAGSNYLSTILVTVVHNSTAKNGKPDWLTKNINDGKVDYFYYLIAVLGVLNMVYFLIVSRTYCYTSSNVLGGENTEYDVELNDTKK